MNKKYTQLRVRRTTRARLGQHGEYEDSIDTIINKILNEVEK